jgi:protein TonB
MVTDNRNFHYAVVASLALHALLLFAFPDLIDTARRAASIPPQIIARLMAPEPAPAPAVQAEEPETKKPVTKKSSPRVPAVQAPVAPAPRVEPAPAVAAEPPAPRAAPASPPVAALEPKPAPAAPPQPAPDSRSRDQYRLQLMEEMARGAKRRYPPRGYPPLARENNWEGSVRIAIAVAADGRTSITLKASSGYEVLDQLALDSLRQAARSVPLPPGLRGKDVAFDLNAIYRLED